MNNLKNKVVFITGASSGIGKACAQRFAGLGCRLILCARRYERLYRLKKTLENTFGIQVLILKLDVRNFENVMESVKKLPKPWKNISVLINNAGLSRGLNKIQDGVLEDWNEMIDTNIKGLLYVTKSVLPFMLKNKNSHIINIGSIAGHEVYTAGNVYCGTKHAVDAITKGMRMDLIESGIRVSTVDPGLVNTEFSLVRFHGDRKKAEKPYEGMKPLKGYDIADVVEFIATRNKNIVIAQVLVLPSAQASSMLVNRKI